MNLSGILVVAERGRHVEVTAALDGLSGVSVHQVDPDTGRLIVVQEAEDIPAEVEGLRRIKALPHVVMAELVYHYLAEDTAEYSNLPPDLAGQGETYPIPTYLQD